MLIFNPLINKFTPITNTFTQPYILTYSHTFTNSFIQTFTYLHLHTFTQAGLVLILQVWILWSPTKQWGILGLPSVPCPAFFPGEFPGCPRNPSSHCPLPSSSFWWVPPILPSSVPLPWSISHCSLDVDHCLLQLGHLTVLMDLAQNIHQC